MYIRYNDVYRYTLLLYIICIGIAIMVIGFCIFFLLHEIVFYLFTKTIK